MEVIRFKQKGNKIQVRPTAEFKKFSIQPKDTNLLLPAKEIYDNEM